MISSFSFNQSLISSIQLKRKRVKNTLEQTTRDLGEYTWRIWDLIANRSSVAKNTFKNGENDHGPSDEEVIAMNDLNHASFDMNRCLVMIVRF